MGNETNQNLNRSLWLANALMPDDTPPWLYRLVSNKESLDLKKDFDAINKAKQQDKIAHLPTKGKESVALRDEAKRILTWPSEKRRQYYLDLQKKEGKEAALKLVNEVTRQRGIKERKQGMER